MQAMFEPSAAFAALGDPTRRAIFESIVWREQSVARLAERVPVSRPAVSQHLRVLKDAGLVVDRAEGTRRIYSVDRAALGSMRSYFDRFWDRALSAFEEVANLDEGEEENP